MQDYTVLGNGSWATALVKTLSDAGKTIAWWMRNPAAAEHILQHQHNPDYLSSVTIDLSRVSPLSDMSQALASSAKILIAIPSAFLEETLSPIDPQQLEDKTIISAVKGIIPGHSLFLHEYLSEVLALSDFGYQFITGPCHAEEVAQEKLSYLTVASYDLEAAEQTCSDLNTHYIKTIFSRDVMGTQVSATLKNIYALGAGILHGLGYGDNFLSVYTTNCFAEASRFTHLYYDVKNPNINSSAYLGDLLVTCYSLHSRNRMFGNLIGQGYSVKSAQIEMGMVAEGLYASQALFQRRDVSPDQLPLAHEIYQILWTSKSPRLAAQSLEQMFV